MNEMVERGARAIYEKRNGHGCKPWSLQTNAHKAPYLDDARAAIEAMREPTDEMVDSGHSRPNDFQHGHQTVIEIYEAMIDAALS